MNVSCLWKSCAGPAVLFSLFALLLIPEPLGAVVTEYEGEKVVWDFVSNSPFNPSLSGCSTRITDEGQTEMQCTYTVSHSPKYAAYYRVNATYTPAAVSSTQAMWTTVKPYPISEEFDFLSPIDQYGPSSSLEHSFECIFIPMWPESVNTAYEIVIRYYSSSRNLGFNINIQFWGFDPTTIPNAPWLRGEPGVNPYLKFCGGKPRPEKEPGGPGR